MFVIHGPDGLILQTIDSVDADNMRKSLSERGQSFIEIGLNPQAFYVVDGALRPRPQLGAALATKGALKAAHPITITGVPHGARVSIDGPNGTTFIHDDPGDVVLNFVFAGTYNVYVDAPPHALSVIPLTVGPA